MTESQERLSWGGANLRSLTVKWKSELLLLIEFLTVNSALLQKDAYFVGWKIVAKSNYTVHISSTSFPVGQFR